MEKKIFIEDIKENMAVDAPFLIENAELRDGSKNKFITCTLVDRTGKMACKCWGRRINREVEEASAGLKSGAVYRVSGRAKTYNNSLELNINDGITLLSEPVAGDSLSPGDYIYSPADIAGNRKAIEAIAGEISDPGLREIVSGMLSGSPGFYEKPAARAKHHDYMGGLAEHTLEVARLACACCDCMPRLLVNRDLVLAGALLHDIGKCRSFEKQGLAFTPLPAYNLIGHVTLGIQMLSEWQGRHLVSDEVFEHLTHIVQSHHGPHGEVKPQTVESWAVHHADNASAMLREVSGDLELLSPGTGQWGKRCNSPVFRFGDVALSSPVPESSSEGSDSSEGAVVPEVEEMGLRQKTLF